MTFKDLKTESGMTQQQLSDFLNIPKRTIENWDSGTSKCPPYVLELIEYKLIHEGMLKTEQKEHYVAWVNSYEDGVEKDFYLTQQEFAFLEDIFSQLQEGGGIYAPDLGIEKKKR